MLDTAARDDQNSANDCSLLTVPVTLSVQGFCSTVSDKLWKNINMNMYSCETPVTDHLHFVMPQWLVLPEYSVICTAPSLIQSASLFSCFLSPFPLDILYLSLYSVGCGERHRIFSKGRGRTLRICIPVILLILSTVNKNNCINISLMFIPCIIRVLEMTNNIHWFVPLLYSMYWLLHISTVACHHQGTSKILLSYLKYKSNGWYII
jgi:hypothetical protein